MITLPKLRSVWMKWKTKHKNTPSKQFRNLFSFSCVVLCCVFTFWVPCCEIRYDFRNNNKKTILGSSLPPVVCRRHHVLFTLLVFVCAKWCPTHIVLCFYIICLGLVYPMLAVSLDCTLWLLLRYSWMFIQSENRRNSYNRYLIYLYWINRFNCWCLTPLSAIFQLYHGDQF